MAAPTKSQDMNEMVMQLRYLQTLYGQQYENIANNINTYTMTNGSLQRNIELLEKAKSVENAQIMISGEGGAYVPAKISKIDMIMTYVGGGYMIDKTVDDSLKFIKDNQSRTEKILVTLAAEKKRVETELIDIDYRLGLLQYQEQQDRQ